MLYLKLAEFKNEHNVKRLNAILESLCETKLLKKLVWQHLAYNRIKELDETSYSVKSATCNKNYLVFYNYAKKKWRCNCEGASWNPYKKCSHILAVFCYKVLKSSPS